MSVALWLFLGGLWGCGGAHRASTAEPEGVGDPYGEWSETSLRVRSDDPEVAECEDEWLASAPPAGRFALPICIRTARGIMSVEGEYLPGVVECELGGAHRAPAALRAQAVAARTYLLAHLRRRRARGKAVKIGPHFQCWKPAKRATSRQAVADTAGVVMVRGAMVLDANYVSGTRKRADDCAPQPPEDSGFDYDSWAEMRDAYYAAKRRGRRMRFDSRFWTEILVTENKGREGDEVRSTPIARRRPTNRGAMSQYGAICLAMRQGLDAPAILRHYYGADAGFSGEFRPGAPVNTPSDDEIPLIGNDHEPLPDLDLEAMGVEVDGS